MKYVSMFFVSGFALISVMGCTSKQTVSASSAAKNRSVASEWQNLLTCDDGLRIDEGPGVSHQIVLFGKAAAHFENAGAIEKNEINNEGEYVHNMMSDRYSYLVVLKNGTLSMPNQLNRDARDFTVQWNPYSNSSSASTNFVFHNCH